MKNRFMGTIFAVGAVLAFSAVMLAQTAPPQPGAAGVQAVPRTPDGKPDLSGVWLAESPTERAARGASSREGGGGRGDRPFQPWAQKLFEYHSDPFVPNRPRNELNPRSTDCFPPDLEYLITNDNDHVEIIQSPQRVLIVYEYDFWVRQVWMDEEHPEDLELKWMGHSIGKWDGDTLVVDTVSIDPLNSYGGFIHTDALHMVERVRRVDHNMLEIVVTVDDPKAYTKPWTFGPIIYILRPDSRIEERVWCNDRYEKGIWYGE